MKWVFSTHPYFSVFILLGTSAILGFVLYFIWWTVKKCSTKEQYISLKKYIKSYVMNAAIRSFLVADLALSFYAVQIFKSLYTINEHHAVSAATGLTIFQHSVTLLALGTIIVSVQRTLVSNQATLNSVETRAKMGNLYRGLRTNDTCSLYYPTVFLCRRFFIAAVFSYIPVFSIQVGLN